MDKLDNAPRLAEAMPALAHELRALLEDEAPELAHQIEGLRIVDRCRCGDAFCATMSVLTDRAAAAASPESDAYDPGSIPLAAKRGMIIVDVRKGRLIGIELLERKEIRDVLRTLLP